MMYFKRQMGISLIEVLISMVLGIFFLGVAVEYLLTGQQSSSVQDTGSRIQENARFSFSMLRDDIRLAGFNGNPAALITPPFIFQGNCNLPNPCTTDDVGTVGDQMAVAFVTDANVNTDCLGTNIPPGRTVANVYWVQQVGGVNSLYCKGLDTATGLDLSAQQPLVDGIEQMQIQYGISTNPGGVADRFLSATAVTAAGAWASVRSVRIALLVDSGLQTDSSDQAGDLANIDTDITYAMLDGPDFTPGDSRIRRVRTTTIELNNSF